MVKIQVNGKEIDFDGTTVEDLIKLYELEKVKIVVEKNEEIVHRDTYSSENLKDGDVVELVRFVGGG